MLKREIGAVFRRKNGGVKNGMGIVTECGQGLSNEVLWLFSAGSGGERVRG